MTSASNVVERFATRESFVDAVATYIGEVANEAVTQRGKFTLALSGGNTPKPIYHRLTQAPYFEQMPWDKTHFFWGDERFVPHDHPDSNFAMAFQELLRHVPVPPKQIHPIPTERSSAEAAAEAYETTLRTLSKQTMLPPAPQPHQPDVGEASSSSPQQKRPPDASNPLPQPGLFFSFDLVLLGMGADGHTASLFPNDPVLAEQARWVRAVRAPAGYSPTERITLTLPLLNTARHVVVMVAGLEKITLSESILTQQEKNLPAALIHPPSPSHWFLSEK